MQLQTNVLQAGAEPSRAGYRLQLGRAYSFQPELLLVGTYLVVPA